MGNGYYWANDNHRSYAAKHIYDFLYPNDYKEHKGVNGNDTSKVMAQRLSESMWLLPLIQSYDLVAQAPCMTDADRKLIETDLIRHAITFINRKRSAEVEVRGRDARNLNWRTAAPTGPRKAIGNWTNFYNAAFARQGYADDVAAVEALWRAGKRERAADRVPIDLGMKTNLLGSPDAVRTRLATYKMDGITTVQAKLSGSSTEQLDTLAQLIDLASCA